MLRRDFIRSVAALAIVRSQPIDLLARIREQAARLQEEAPSLVAREQYEQTIISISSGGNGWTTNPSVRPPEKRKLISELVMVRLPETAGWMSFRDVLQVDGRKVNDRQQRLIDLLTTPNPNTLQQARALAAESARFNIGRVARTINVPDIGLEFLSARHAARISFNPPERTRIEGAQALVLRFNERTGPTILRTPEGRDLLVSGRVWVEAESAALLRTEVVVRDRQSVGSCVVDFAMDERMAIRVPSKMTERYDLPGETINGVAEYSDYRRFGVATSEKVTKPPGGGFVRR